MDGMVKHTLLSNLVSLYQGVSRQPAERMDRRLLAIDRSKE